MNYPFLVTVMQVAGLVLLAGCAIGLLRLITIHFIQHDWTREQARSLLPLTALQSAGLLVFAFSAGGILAIRFFETNELPPLPLFSAQVALMAVLAAGTVFLHVVARPWLCEFDTETEDDAPLVMRLGIHRLIAMTLAFAAFASAWVLWVVMAWPDAAAPPANQLLSAFAITTLVLWALLAVPAVVLRGAALYYTGDFPGELHVETSNDGQQVAHAVAADFAPRRTMPLLPDVPQHQPFYVPAPRAPRPTLMSHEEYFSG